MIKQIYASLELNDNEVRIIVSEYFNTRFNVLKVARSKCLGIHDFQITEINSVKYAISSCLKEIYEKLGAKLEKVILLIPPVNFKRFPVKVNVTPSDKGITKQDIATAINKSSNVQIDADVCVVNKIPVKYLINGISTKTIPENENIDECVVNVDLLCADKDIIYSYCCAVEECGLEIMDICLSNYAICKEAVLFEQSFNSNLILVDMNYSYTSLSVLTKGRLVASKTLSVGTKIFIDEVYKKYPISPKDLMRIIKYNTTLSELNDDVIYAYSKDEMNFNITNRSLNEIVLPLLREYANQILQYTKEVFEAGQSIFVLTNDASDIYALASYLDSATGAEIKNYHPDMIGVRDSNLIALYGSLFAERDVACLNDKNVDCIDLLEFERIVDNSKIDVEGETLTTKIKSLFAQYLNKEK